jgi:hypothetical protein
MALSAKEAAIKAIEDLPDDTTLDDIMYAICVRKKIERGSRDIDEGNTVSHEEVMREVGEWLNDQTVANANFHIEREGHVSVLVPDRPLPPITTEMVNALIDEMRREREDRGLGLTERTG